MNKLLWANFNRLLRDRAFCLGCAFLAGMSAYLPILHYIEQGDRVNPNNYFFGFNIVIGVFAAVCCSLYLGTEYSEGTMRNKLIAGHTRKNIYLANLIICTAASLLAVVIYLAAESIVGIPLNGNVRMGPGELLVRFLVSALMILSFSSIFTLISMLNQSKAAGAVLNILLFLALLALAFSINARLEEPEFIQNYYMLNELGDVTQVEPMPNPRYLQGAAREAYEFVYDFLPTGQGIQMCTKVFISWIRMACCNVGITAGTTALGVYLFGKKDIR
ncbi:MAG: ABC transporter permease subunit [Lachnospiraceae bacterium]|jgi:ABC-2 type transport system permease protein|nr:ABC transporter permease subunit [Lachnospiraceae bacterium]